ncbi:MAG: hypothetical protein AAGD88_04005 [Bacteroidota bacterium]
MKKSILKIKEDLSVKTLTKKQTEMVYGGNSSHQNAKNSIQNIRA